MRAKITYLVAVVSAILVVCAFVLPIFQPRWFTKEVKGAILASWLVVPPLWFWWEYCFLFQGKDNQESFDCFKYAQEVSRNLWIGVAAALTLLYFGRPF